jgi:SAUR family protein
MMSMKGYFRAPRLHGRKQQHQAAAAKHRGELCGGESLSAALLDADAGDELAAAAAVPKGCFAVYVGAEARRFVVPTSYLRQPAFRDLMERAAEEFGFARAGAIRIPCREEDFQATVAALDDAAAAARRRRRPRRAGTAAAVKLPKAWSL